MALERPTKGSQEEPKKEYEEYEFLSEEGVDKPWWRLFIQKVTLKRDAYINHLLAGMDDTGAPLDVKREDRLRGQISTLNWIILVDTEAKNRKEAKDGRRR